MIVTVLWEDQRGGQIKGFGPHALLVACVADSLGLVPNRLKGLIESHPKKGNGNVIVALRRDLERLANSGPVVAVFDRDKIPELVNLHQPVADCRRITKERIRNLAPGNYEVVFLERNIETLIEAVCRVLGESAPEQKPRPDERDRILGRAVWASPDVRRRIRDECPSFSRLVDVMARYIGGQPR